jgi:hypothetical protein
MKRLGLLMGLLVCVSAIGAGSASAFEGGGRSPSAAPLVSYGQHYTASLDNRKEDANFGGRVTIAFWKLPSLTTHDQVVVNWHELPFAHNSEFPICVTLVQGIDEFNWGSVLESSGGGYGYCDGANIFEVSPSGTAATSFTVQNTDPNSYLEFFAPATATETPKYETFPYDFTVEAPRHYLGLSLGSVSKVASNGYLHATATLATGAPVPDGSPFTLTGTWSGGGVFTGGATSVAGQITFPLSMPEAAFGKDVEFVASSAATSEYQAAASSTIYAEVTKPPAPPAPPKPVDLCTPATNKAHAWARIYKRRMKEAERARGRAGHGLRQRAHIAERKFIAARAAKKVAC